MSGPGRPRKPSKLRIVEGHRGHRPIPEDAPTVAGVPPMPSNFSEDQQTAWNDLVRWAPQGVLTHSDAGGLERAAIALAKVRAGDFRGKSSGFQALAWEKQVMGWLSKFGMTPVDRAKLGTTPKKPEKASDPPAGLGYAQ